MVREGALPWYEKDAYDLSSEGQVAIPKSVRDRLHLEAGTKVSIDVQGESLVMKRWQADSPTGEPWKAWPVVEKA